MFEHAVRSDDVFKDVLAHMCVHSGKWVVQQVDVRVLVHRPGQRHPLLLSATVVQIGAQCKSSSIS